MPQVYSHRNGETEPPTENYRFYWFYGDEETEFDDAFGMVYVGDGDSNDCVGLESVPINVMRGRWWGPVTPPWDNE